VTQKISRPSSHQQGEMAWWHCLTSSCCSSSVGDPPGIGLYLESKLALSFSRVWLTESASSWN
jgi:hypothetical protein